MKKTMMSVLVVCIALSMAGCPEFVESSPPVANSGVKQIKVKVQTDASGMTVEQQNVKERLLRDNLPGSIKHLYVFNLMSNKAMIYSAVDGKVTSSGKRLTPTSVAAGRTGDGSRWGAYGIPVRIEGEEFRTSEVIQDDGTYGRSIEYLYWFDTKGVYHQHYLSGDQMVHVSDAPLRVPMNEITLVIDTVE